MAISDSDFLLVSDGITNYKTTAGDLAQFINGKGPKQPQIPGDPPEDIWIDVDTTLAVQSGGPGSTASLQNSIEFAVANFTYNQSDKSITAGQVVRVRWMDSKLIEANHGQTVSGTLYAKTGADFTQTWSLVVNKEPLDYSLVDVSGQPTSTAITSAITVPTGINAPVAVTIDGGTLTNIEVSINAGPYTANPGNVIAGQPIQVRGTTGASHTTTYTAIVTVGTKQETWNVTTAGSSAAVAQPSVSSPTNGETGVTPSPTIQSTAYVPINGATGHTSSDWELKKSGVTVDSSNNDTSNLTSWNVTNLEVGGSYSVRVKYRDSNSVESPWSAESSFIVSPPVPGDPMGGGFYAGQINVFTNEETYNTPSSTTLYNLIVSPKTVTENGVTLYGEKPQALWFATPDSKNEPIPDATRNLVTGIRATEFICTNQPQYSYYPALMWAIDPEGPNAGAFHPDGGGPGTGIGGYNDWYIPALCEQMVVYFGLKPTLDKNFSNPNPNLEGAGNPNSVCPYCPNTSLYEGYPAITERDWFKESTPYGPGAERYRSDKRMGYSYWTSSMGNRNANHAASQINFLTGQSSHGHGNSHTCFVRAIRRVLA